jgi:hypothetical protein
VAYLALQLSTNFFSAGLTREALRALRGEPISVRAGVAAAGERLPALASYTVVSSSIGLAVELVTLAGRAPDGRVRFAGRLFRFLLGAGWTLASYLALPVLIQERRGGMASLRRSAQLLRQTWGETLLGELGATAATYAFYAIAILIAIVLARLFDDPVLPVLIAVVALLVAFAILADTLRTIYRAALYIFATEGIVPGPFDAAGLEGVWSVK